MGARQRIEERMLLKAEKRRKLISNMNILRDCINQAEEEKLPSASGLRAILNILEDTV